MDIVGAAEPSKDDNFTKRTAFQEEINIHERRFKDFSSLGQEEGKMAKLARAELEKLREQVKQLTSPGTAHKQALQKLGRARGHITKGKKEIEDLEKRLLQMQSDTNAKKAVAEAKEAETVALEQQVAQHASKLPGAKEVFAPQLPEDLFTFDTEDAEFQGEDADAVAVRGFVDQPVAHPHWARVQSMLRKKAQTKFEQADA
eukprot:5680530-Pyramimonas_sp.AAC.1